MSWISHSDSGKARLLFFFSWQQFSSRKIRRLPIGSGVIESGHRHVLHSRKKGRGRAWLHEHADQITDLRVSEPTGNGKPLIAPVFIPSSIFGFTPLLGNDMLHRVVRFMLSCR